MSDLLDIGVTSLEDEAMASRQPEFNIYDDLIITDSQSGLAVSLPEVYNQRKMLQYQVCVLTKQLEDTKSDLWNVTQEKERLEKNFNSLLITAKLECQRKNRLIEELQDQLDGMNPPKRRFIPKPDETHKPQAVVETNKKRTQISLKGRRIDLSTLSSASKRASVESSNSTAGVIKCNQQVAGAEFEHNPAPVSSLHQHSTTASHKQSVNRGEVPDNKPQKDSTREKPTASAAHSDYCHKRKNDSDTTPCELAPKLARLEEPNEVHTLAPKTRTRNVGATRLADVKIVSDHPPTQDCEASSSNEKGKKANLTSKCSAATNKSGTLTHSTSTISSGCLKSLTSRNRNVKLKTSSESTAVPPCSVPISDNAAMSRKDTKSVPKRARIVSVTTQELQKVEKSSEPSRRPCLDYRTAEIGKPSSEKTPSTVDNPAPREVAQPTPRAKTEASLPTKNGDRSLHTIYPLKKRKICYNPPETQNGTSDKSSATLRPQNSVPEQRSCKKAASVGRIGSAGDTTEVLKRPKYRPNGNTVILKRVKWLPDPDLSDAGRTTSAKRLEETVVVSTTEEKSTQRAPTLRKPATIQKQVNKPVKNHETSVSDVDTSLWESSSDEFPSNHTPTAKKKDSEPRRNCALPQTTSDTVSKEILDGDLVRNGPLKELLRMAYDFFKASRRGDAASGF